MDRWLIVGSSHPEVVRSLFEMGRIAKRLAAFQTAKSFSFRTRFPECSSHTTGIFPEA